MRKRNWFIVGSGVLITGVIGSAIYFIPPDTVLGSFTQVDASGETVVLPAVGEGSPELTVSPPRQVIRPAAEVLKIEATGNITLQKQETVLSKVKALITAVHVKVGDSVAAGDVLVELDTQNLQREVEEARFNLSKAQTELKKLTQPAEPEKVTAAQQKLLIAQEELAKVKAGPEPVELQGAETEVFVAWAKYNDLVAGKSEDELASDRTALKDAEIALKR
ncbi:MAG: biotin/lipoyl-binding protein, partial [Anaerolineae bacterium]